MINHQLFSTVISLLDISVESDNMGGAGCTLTWLPLELVIPQDCRLVLCIYIYIFISLLSPQIYFPFFFLSSPSLLHALSLLWLIKLIVPAVFQLPFSLFLCLSLSFFSSAVPRYIKMQVVVLFSSFPSPGVFFSIQAKDCFTAAICCPPVIS